MPNMEGIESSVFSSYLGMSILESTNLITLSILIRILFPFDPGDVNKFMSGCIIFLPPLTVNYYIIYHKSGYKKILKEYSHVKKGSLIYIAVYLIVTLTAMIGAVYLLNTEAK